MLDAGTIIVIDVLLNLALTNAVCWLINRHLHVFVKICHDDRSEGRIVSVNHLIIHGPESMEVKHLLVPTCSWLHLTIRLVSNAVIHILETWDWHNIIQNFF